MSVSIQSTAGVSAPPLRTYCCIIEDDECIRVIEPFDLEASELVFPLAEYGLDVSRLELRWEAGQSQDTGGEGRERVEGGDAG